MLTKIEEQIIFENEEIVVVNKPSGMLTIPDREGKDISLKQLLKNKYGGIFIVHRLDRETSGIIVFAKNEETHKQLSRQFENRETKKTYHGLILGKPPRQSGIINAPIAEHPSRKGMMTVYKKGKESITEYEIIENFRLYTWMKFSILTGRTHQIRVHMKYIGHPIVCDDIYGDGKQVFISALKKKFNLSKDQETERPILSRLALHSSLLQFEVDSKPYDFEAPLPKDLKALLQQLRKIHSS